MASVTKSVALALVTLVSGLLAACSKPDPPEVRSDPAKLQPDEAKSAAAPAAWAQPHALCIHTVGVCEANESCAGTKAKMNAAGIYAYQLFDVECEKWIVKRQQVLGVKYEVCAACLRDANDPKSVQACMFVGGPCH